MKVFIWGTGNIALRYLQQGEVKAEDIIGFIETQKSKDIFYGKKVYEPNEIAKMHTYDYIIVCLYYYSREIYDICLKLDIDVDKLILADAWEWIDGSNMKKSLNSCCRKITENCADAERLFPVFYQLFVNERDIQARRYIAVSRNGYDLQEKDALIWQKDFESKEYQTDYFRYRTFELVANEIIRQKIEGAVAEVGVFKGAFAKMINAKFPKKKLYLFDTFESFDVDEFKQELTLGRCPESFFETFKNTSVESVLSIMPYREKCIVRQGLFPNTAEGMENEKYAFVSIDVDFEKSVLEALRYFYPRLNHGGVIFIHDYNNRFLEGVKKAVATYEEEYVGGGILKIPLADEGGTVVIVK